MSESYTSGTTPLIVNPSRVIEVKILEALNSGGAAGSGQVLNGHGVPAITPSSNAAIYTDLDTNTLYQWNGSSWV